MKRLLLTAFLLAATLVPSGFAREEKEALEAFKKDTLEMKAWADEKEKTFAGNPLAPLYAMGEMVTKSKAINTEGLPADLKASWETVIGGFEKIAALVTKLPKDPADLQKAMSDPAFQKDFGMQMVAIQKEMLPNMAKLREISQKYGVEGLGKMGKPGAK